MVAMPDGTPRYRRNPAVREAPVDGEVFLVVPDGEDVFYLDALSSGLWRALADPLGGAELAALYGAAFPDVDRAAIDADVAAALAVLAAKGLVGSADDEPA